MGNSDCILYFSPILIYNRRCFSALNRKKFIF